MKFVARFESTRAHRHRADGGYLKERSAREGESPVIRAFQNRRNNRHDLRYVDGMRSPPVHRLAVDSHDIFTYRAGSYLALFDLGTYTRYVAREADSLDISAHLQRQTKALTILAWNARQPIVRLDLVVIPEDEPLEKQVPGGRQPFAHGWLRTFGRLALTGNELLETCARDAEFDLLHSAASGRPRLFDVPAGTYAVSIFGGDDAVSDLVILRHHPFPPPRVAPVRLGGLVLDKL